MSAGKAAKKIEEDTESAGAEGTEELAAEGDGQKKNKKKMIIAIAALLALVGGGVGLYFGGVFSKHEPAADSASAETGHEETAKPAEGHSEDAKSGGEHAAASEGESHGEAGHGDSAQAKKATPLADGTVFYDLPDFLVNLNNGNNKTSFLKVSVTLEIADEDGIKKIESLKPRIVDSFNVYLRELRPNDLRGSAGIYRLREELLMRVNKTVQPAQVNDILFREMIVQ